MSSTTTVGLNVCVLGIGHSRSRSRCRGGVCCHGLLPSEKQGRRRAFFSLVGILSNPSLSPFSPASGTTTVGKNPTSSVLKSLSLLVRLLRAMRCDFQATVFSIGIDTDTYIYNVHIHIFINPYTHIGTYMQHVQVLHVCTSTYVCMYIPMSICMYVCM